jgi:hypothetical protein
MGFVVDISVSVNTVWFTAAGYRSGFSRRVADSELGEIYSIVIQGFGSVPTIYTLTVVSFSEEYCSAQLEYARTI